MKPPPNGLFHKHGPAVLLLLLLLVIGFGIYRKSSTETTPPFYDSLSYYLKARGVWEQLAQGSIAKTLDVEPTVRPPGTVLVSYPFGFSPNFQGFFFRTVYIPIVLWVAALWLLAARITPPGGNRWTAAALIGGFASFSMFYHFAFSLDLDARWNFCGPWGQMDGFLASLAAMATSLALLSARKRSLGLAAASAVVGVWALLVKPAGMLVMPLVFWLWLVETCIHNWSQRRTWRNDRGLWIYVISAAAMMILLFASVFVACLRHKYLAYGNWSNMAGAVKLLYTDPGLIPKFNFGVLDSWVAPTLGWHWFIFLIVAIAALAVANLARAIRWKWIPEDLRFPAALIGLAGSLYWWLFMSGVQVRYLFPFLLVFVVAILPDLLRYTGKLGPRARCVLGSMSFAPAVLLSGLILAKPSPLPLQRAMGVSVNGGGFEEAVQIGHLLVAEARNRNANVLTYSVDMNRISVGIVHAVDEIERIAQPNRPGVAWYFGFDWTRGVLISRSKLLESDYVLFTPPRNPAEILRIMDIQDDPTEARIFSAWFEQLDRNDGVELVTGNTLRLLRIVDRQKLNAAFEKFVLARRWRPEFQSESMQTNRASLPWLFGASTESVFRASPEENVPALHPNPDLILAPETGRILLRAAGPQPSLALPDIEIPADRDAIVRIRMDSSAKTQMVLRYAMGAKSGSMQGSGRELAAGGNELYFLVPCDGNRIHLSLDPVQFAGDLSLLSMEVRAVRRQ